MALTMEQVFAFKRWAMRVIKVALQRTKNVWDDKLIDKGGGWLAQLEYPFSDFAGSTIVHATGGWAAMMGAIVLGPRIGKYDKDGKPRAIPGHSIDHLVQIRRIIRPHKEDALPTGSVERLQHRSTLILDELPDQGTVPADEGGRPDLFREGLEVHLIFHSFLLCCRDLSHQRW